MPRLVEIRCPECGASQSESAHAISTFCRACSAHIEIGAPPSALPPRTARRPASSRAVHCYACGRSHPVAPLSRSTICPHCSAAIEIGELVVTGVSSRAVDLRGRLVVAGGARLSAPRIICTDARLEGAASGTLFCEGEARLAGSGRLALLVFASSLFVEKHAEVTLAYPVCSERAEIRGRLDGRLFLRGHLLISKGGAFHGPLRARSATVERGGILCGPAWVSPREPAGEPALPSDILPAQPGEPPAAFFSD